jgi:hypothetical protein
MVSVLNMSVYVYRYIDGTYRKHEKGNKYFMFRFRLRFAENEL